MNEERLSFQELKARVSVIDVASFLGYQYDRSKGVTQPSFVLTDGGGTVLDRIYVKNPNDNSHQGYWRRNGVNNTGDVISFVKENIEKFGVSGRNELDMVNKVLHKFAGKDFETPASSEYKQHSKTSQTFNPERWEQIYSPQVRDKIFSARNISTYTTIAFSKFIHIVQDKEQGGKYSNVGFPYSIPGEDKIVGYELRGVNNFKSKAAGTNSSEGMWLASFADSPEKVKNIYITESAFDALAFYQLHKERIDLKSSAFVSFGGSFSDKQMIGLSQQFPTARPVLLFDKDLNGHMYDIRAIALISGTKLQARLSGDSVHIEANGKKFDILQEELSAKKFSELSGISIPSEQLLVYKPPKDIKDWNDVLLQESNTPSKYEIRR